MKLITIPQRHGRMDSQREDLPQQYCALHSIAW